MALDLLDISTQGLLKQLLKGLIIPYGNSVIHFDGNETVDQAVKPLINLEGFFIG